MDELKYKVDEVVEDEGENGAVAGVEVEEDKVEDMANFFKNQQIEEEVKLPIKLSKLTLLVKLKLSKLRCLNFFDCFTN